MNVTTSATVGDTPGAGMYVALAVGAVAITLAVVVARRGRSGQRR